MKVTVRIGRRRIQIPWQAIEMSMNLRKLKSRIYRAPPGTSNFSFCTLHGEATQTMQTHIAVYAVMPKGDSPGWSNEFIQFIAVDTDMCPRCHKYNEGSILPITIRVACVSAETFHKQRLQRKSIPQIPEKIQEIVE